MGPKSKNFIKKINFFLKYLNAANYYKIKVLFGFAGLIYFYTQFLSIQNSNKNKKNHKKSIIFVFFLKFFMEKLISKNLPKKNLEL